MSGRQELTLNYKQANALIKAYVNTDGFEKFFLSRHTRLSHTDKTPGQAIKIFRKQVCGGDIIPLKFYDPFYPSNSIGGWVDAKGYLLQNVDHKMDSIRRAGHLLHEASHKYGWKHKGNSYKEHDNLNSFPYAVGYAFEDYVRKEIKPSIAAQ